MTCLRSHAMACSSQRDPLSATGHPRGQSPHAAAAGDLVEGSKLSRETSRERPCSRLTHERTVSTDTPMMFDVV